MCIVECINFILHLDYDGVSTEKEDRLWGAVSSEEGTEPGSDR